MDSAEYTQLEQRLIAAERRVDDLHSQIKKLADFIIEEIPGEPSTSDGAVDVAIRLLRNYIQAITDNDLLYDLVDEAISTWLGDYASTVEVMAKLTALRDRHRP